MKLPDMLFQKLQDSVASNTPLTLTKDECIWLVKLMWAFRVRDADIKHGIMRSDRLDGTS